MKRKLNRITIGSLFLGIVFAIWFATRLAYVETIHPSAMGITMTELGEQIGMPENLRPHSHNGSSYTLWSGPVKAIFLPSGPPVYVFDSAGLLVDWSRDSGDDPEFREKWGL